MKNILVLNGSPRKKGNTSILCEHLIKSIGQNIEQVFLYDYNIKACRDCRVCKKDDLVCVIKDDMQILYNKIDQADFLIIGTPVYWFGPTATTKQVLDRFRPYFVNKKLNGKKAVLFLPAGSGAGDCDLTVEMFKRSFNALGVELIDVVTSESYDKGDALKDKVALSHIEILATAIMN